MPPVDSSSKQQHPCSSTTSSNAPAHHPFWLTFLDPGLERKYFAAQTEYARWLGSAALLGFGGAMCGCWAICKLLGLAMDDLTILWFAVTSTALGLSAKSKRLMDCVGSQPFFAVCMLYLFIALMTISYRQGITSIASRMASLADCGSDTCLPLHGTFAFRARAEVVSGQLRAICTFFLVVMYANVGVVPFTFLFSTLLNVLGFLCYLAAAYALIQANDLTFEIMPGRHLGDLAISSIVMVISIAVLSIKQWSKEYQSRLSFIAFDQVERLQAKLLVEKEQKLRVKAQAKAAAEANLSAWICHEIRYAANHGTLQSSPP